MLLVVKDFAFWLDSIHQPLSPVNIVQAYFYREGLQSIIEDERSINPFGGDVQEHVRHAHWH